MGWQAATTAAPSEAVQQTLFAPPPKGPAAAIAAYLTDNPDSTADQMAAASPSHGKLLSTLMEMEFLDQIITLPGNRFRNA